MAVKLHRCPLLFVKMQGHPCWRVQSALNEQGIDYEVVKGPISKGKRTALQTLSGQSLFPVVEFEDGTVYREQSKDMAAKIRAGRLFEGRAPAAAPAAPSWEPAQTHEHEGEHTHEPGEEHEH
jgi:hypothetical protein